MPRTRGRAVLAGAAAAVVVLAVGVGVVRQHPDAGPPAAPRTPTVVGTPAVGPSPTPAAVAVDPRYGPMTTYPAPDRPVPGPDGFVPVFVDHLGRHGSRTLVSPQTTRRALALWDRARQEGSLTPLGRRLGPVLDEVDRTTRRLGPGTLTTRGEREERGIGRREAQRLRALFDGAGSSRGEVEVVTSGVPRAVASAASFVEGLHEVAPDLEVRAPRVDRRLLYFHETDRGYADFLRHGPWRASYDRATADEDLPDVARSMLGRLYGSGLVARLDDPVGEAEQLVEVYRAAPALADDVEVDLTPFVSGAAADAFAFDEDARIFYSRGPGAPGDDRSYRAAQVLLDDFDEALRRRTEGGSTVAVLRFAHAEQVVPFAALLQLPGSQPLERGRLYRWQDSAFRSAAVTPLAANITWTLWRDPSGGSVVSVQVDERPAALGRGCRAEAGLPTYYRLEELRRCLG